MHIVAGAALALALSSCTAPNPRSCADGNCTDPSYPFCDKDGEFEGTPNTCIAVECQAGGFERCLGDLAVLCNGGGNNYDIRQCEHGCADMRGCTQCMDSSQCNMAAPVCDASGTCRACALDDECPSRICEAGMCVAESGILYASPGGVERGTCPQSAPCSVGRATSLAMTAPALRVVRMLPGAYALGLVLDGVTSSPLRIVATGATVAARVGIRVSGGASGVVRGIGVTGVDFGVTCGASGQPHASLLLEDATVSAGDVFTIAINLENCTVTFRRGTIDTKASNGSAIGVSNDASFVGDRLFVRGQNRPGIGGAFTSNMNIRLTNSILERVSVLLVNGDVSPPGSSLLLGYNTLIGTDLDCGPRNNRTVIYENNVVRGENVANVVTGNGCTIAGNVLFPQSMPYPGNILAEPQLVDAVGGDYHLTPASPARDAAVPTASFPAITTDYDGTERPQGGANDSGAFERKP